MRGTASPAPPPPKPAPASPLRRALAVVTCQTWLLMMLPGLLWSGNVILGRAVSETMPPVGLTFWRWAVASVFALPLALPHLRRDWPAMVRAWPRMVLLSLLGAGGFNLFQYIAAHTTTAVNLVTLGTASPVLVLAITYVLFGDRVTPRQAAGILLSILGALTLVAHGDPGTFLRLSFTPGDLWMLAAVICTAFYVALLRLAPKVHPLSFLFGTFVISAAALLPLYLAETALGRPVPFSLNGIAAILYVAIFASILGYLAFNRVVELLGPNIGGLAVYLVPVFGVILAAIFLHELPQPYHFAGIAFIAAGIYLATRKR